ncbi:hypothetical protein Rsub_06371 [Raphidocelis subcapitata]|uniref:Uncharacterized protein n=1 Tax=Raphidocelis subcapitata TaxID=307507 RepID=A0A2V0P641_9CHLO|nr:hypothetical protein Rsub_06371 [Raphidocelis subcapitata]|eukprot:GBF93333.1 hypothetical protein Rsub_06371 [Raphidocelis subcapitata]
MASTAQSGCRGSLRGGGLLPRPACAWPAPRRVCGMVASAGKKQQQPVVAEDPYPAVASTPQTSQWSTALPLVAMAATTFGAAYFYKIKAEKAKPQQQQLEPWPEIPRPDADPRAYKLALARTRQALDVQRAVAYMKAGEPARAMVELHRALDENAVCRSPLLDGHQTRADLRDLYKLHLLNTAVPHSFAKLLQLRELLGISNQEAEDIEVDTLEEGTAFSI